VLAAATDIGGYRWTERKPISLTGMPLYGVGQSDVRFREIGRTTDSQRLQDARDYFPELCDFSWPERGSIAELDSLLFQAGRHKATRAPDNLSEACRRLIEEYPRAPVPRYFRGQEWSQEEITQAVSEVAERDVNKDASPGVPYFKLGTTNRAVLAQHMHFISFVVAARLEALSQMPLEENLNPEELVKRGYCDPVRLFVKQEPHPRRKIEQRRFRLISSVSLADQLVERLLFGYQNRMEIALWRTTPSKPGMGLSLLEQATAIWRDLVHKHSTAPACEADISGFDWSVQEWELLADVEMRIALGRFPPKLAHAARARFRCLAGSVF
jgi:hypothetical protein